jgi:hypothetical protein
VNGGYSVDFTALAARDLRRIAMDLYRQWKSIRFSTLDEATDELRRWIVDPLAADPLSESSRELGHPNARYIPVDRGIYFGNYHIAYIALSDERRCIVILIQANLRSVSEFVNEASRRARHEIKMLD